MSHTLFQQFATWLPSSGPATPLQTFFFLLLALFLAAIPAFSLGVLAGWVQWCFFANRTIRSLEGANAQLRGDLQDNPALSGIPN